MATRAVRFNEKEERAIKTFLERNPFFDFSTLARMAIINFIQNPNIEFAPSQLVIEEGKEKEH